MTPSRTSYLPCEILWGHRFEQMQLYRKDNNKFEINFSAFHSTLSPVILVKLLRSADTRMISSFPVNILT